MFSMQQLQSKAQAVLTLCKEKLASVPAMFYADGTFTPNGKQAYGAAVLFTLGGWLLGGNKWPLLCVALFPAVCKAAIKTANAITENEPQPPTVPLTVASKFPAGVSRQGAY